MKRLDEIFHITYGSQLDLNKCIVCKKPDGFNFVNRSCANCGVSSRILEVDNKTPFLAGTITVAMGGSVLSSFLQQEPYYTGQNVKVLTPKEEMTDIMKLFYCQCIELNRFRFSTFGREANYTFNSILVPDINENPKWVKRKQNLSIPFDEKPLSNKYLQLNTENWKWFDAINLFDMYAGKYYPNDTFENGVVPLVTASETNNGIMKYTDLKAVFPANCLTIGKVGMSVFYQPKPFCASPDVTVLRPKLTLSKFAMLFVKCILDKDKYRWNYGRQIRLGDSLEIKIKLPATANGAPDWQFMEDYIKALPYSRCL